MRKKVAKPYSTYPREPRRQLSVGDPVLAGDYRISRNLWTKSVVISKFGPLTYRVQVDFIWKRHIDQLIQPKAGEVIEDSAFTPRQTPPAIELVLEKDYLYSPPLAKA